MDLLQGLNSRQVGALRHIREYKYIPAGEVIFAEGDAAANLFAIVSGMVQIYRQTVDGETEVARLTSGDVFGEMGILVGDLGVFTSAGTRTASARAVEDTMVMSFSANPLEMFQEIGDHESALAILKNLVSILAERLRSKDSPHWVPLAQRSMPTMTWTVSNSQGPLDKLRAALPQGILRRMLGERTLKAGDFLCNQGDKPDGFYFIHEGELEVSQSGSDGVKRVLATLHGPTIAGEIAFFSGEPQAASLLALTDLRYDVFSGSEFRKLAAKKPQEAFEVLFATAQLTVCLILKRENG